MMLPVLVREALESGILQWRVNAVYAASRISAIRKTDDRVQGTDGFGGESQRWGRRRGEMAAGSENSGPATRARRRFLSLGNDTACVPSGFEACLGGR